MDATIALPVDDSLPGLAAIRSLGLAAIFPALFELGEIPEEVLLRGHSPGKRATLEVRGRNSHFAVKLYPSDPAEEAELYRALVDDPMQPESSAARAPALLAHDRDLHALAIGWFNGPSARDLIERWRGGERAGELAALWMHRASKLELPFGKHIGAKQVLHRTGKWTAALGSADPRLGILAHRAAAILASTRPEEGQATLLNGRLYARHVIDLGTGVGVLDWDNFGRGPLEVDAGMFLASLDRTGIANDALAMQAARAQAAFLAVTNGLLDPCVLAWHRSASLLCLAYNGLARSDGDWVARDTTILELAVQLAEAGLTREINVSRDANVPAMRKTAV